jgi:hypothetical protein
MSTDRIAVPLAQLEHFLEHYRELDEWNCADGAHHGDDIQ